MSVTSRTRPPVAVVIGLAVIVAFWLATIAAPARAQTPGPTPPQKLTSIVQPSIVHVRAQFSGLARDRRGEDLTRAHPVAAGTSCSGFIVDPNGFITTSGHCLDLDLGAEGVIDEFVQGLWKRDRARSVGHFASLADLRKHARAEWTVVSPTRPSHVRPDRLVRVAFGASIGAPPASVRRPARVRRVRGFVNGDLALIKIEAHDLPAVELGESAPVGTDTVSIGFAGRVTDVIAPTFEQGSITGTKTLADGLRSVYTTDVSISSGMRGGPTSTSTAASSASTASTPTARRRSPTSSLRPPRSASCCATRASATKSARRTASTAAQWTRSSATIARRRSPGSSWS
jgi:serine protease Do